MATKNYWSGAYKRAALGTDGEMGAQAVGMDDGGTGMATGKGAAAPGGGFGSEDWLKTYMDAANGVSPYRKRLNDRGAGILDDEGRAGFDVTQSKYLAPYLDLYKRAASGEDAINNLGAAGWGASEFEQENPALLARMNSQANEIRSTNAAGSLHDAYRGLHEEGLQLTDAAAGDDWSRRSALLGAASGVYGSKLSADTSRYGIDTGAATSRYSTDVGASTSRYVADKNADAIKAAAKKSMWGQIISGLFGGAGQAAGGFAAAGM